MTLERFGTISPTSQTKIKSISCKSELKTVSGKSIVSFILSFKEPHCETPSSLISPYRKTKTRARALFHFLSSFPFGGRPQSQLRTETHDELAHVCPLFAPLSPYIWCLESMAKPPSESMCTGKYKVVFILRKGWANTIFLSSYVVCSR